MDIKEVKPEYPDEKLGQQSRAEEVYGRLNPKRVPDVALIRSSATAPTNAEIPKTIFEQFRMYNNGGGLIRLYYYDTTYAGWQYINVTGSVT